ncbi:MAG: hypothetical protein M3O29_08190 [Actinomycetota bacterium]|nr:hypothetical protein [Actinomycetota bacterium]
MTGPTTTGSIDAKLTVDDSDFKRGMAEAKAEAKEVGALEPTVKVDANVGPALAKLEAVAKAERDLDMAYQRSAISQEKLTQATHKYGEESTQAASARLAHSRATASETAAEEKLTRAKAASTVEEDKSTAATNRNNDARHRGNTGLMVLLAVAPAALAALAPLSGAAVGLGVSLGTMGLSGVLAIKGIKDAMKVGDDVGQQYAAGLGMLKSNLNELSATSANSMLGGFSKVVGDINSHMPFLNQMVGEGAGLLGRMGGSALSGLLNGLQQMNPLIQMGGIELGKFVTWLFSFTNSNGFSEFINYAQANLPAVMHLIESLVTLVGRIIEAFAPLGPVVVSGLTALSDVLAGLPLPVLAGLVTTATLLGPAFRGAFAVAPLIISVAEAIGLTGVMANLAVPVVGILLAAIAGLGMMAATAAIGTDQGTVALNSYTQALKDDNEAIGEHVRLQAARALADAGAFDAARTLGVSQTTLTNALLGVAGAQDIVNDAISRGKTFQNDWSQGVVDANTGIYVATAAQDKMGKAIDTVTKTLDTQKASLQQSKQTNDDIAAATANATGATSAQTAANQLLSNQFGTTTAAIKAASDAQDKTAQSTADATTKMQLQNDAAGLLKMTLDGLNGKAISAAQAQNSFDSSLTNMGDHVSKTGKQITFTTTSIGDMSSASVALRGQLNTQVSGLQAVVEANGGLDESTGKARAQMETMRQQIIDNAVAHGVDKDAVTAYVDNLLTIPKTVPPTKVDIDKAEAELKLQGFQSAIDRLTGKTVHIYSIEHIQQVRDSGDTPTANAMNTANQYAQGNAYRSEGGPIYRSGGGPANYLAAGGSPFPGVPRGTDTIPAWLTPDEFVMQRASAKSIGPAALNYMNSTGQLPPGQGSGPVTVNLILDGQIIDTRIVDLTHQTMDGVARQLGGMRR